MENFINYAHIKNFKSIVNLELEDCRRINLFIGYPNVGKSNVLEALSLFSLPFLENGDNLNKLARVENAVELFHSSSERNVCTINTNYKNLELLLKSPYFLIFQEKDNNEMIYSFDEELNLLEKAPHSSEESKKLRFYDESNIKRYTFNPNHKWRSDNKSQLLPPFGENIIDTLSYNNNMSEVKTWLKQEFAKFGLEYVLDKSSNSLKVQRRLGDNEVMQLPYSSIADTLQRVIFYKTAIASNQNSVLLFEEPEAHAFPPYIANIMQDIIDAKTNQFFIVTHSPFVVNDFLEYEHLRRETSIYLFDFKNDQTIVKRLTDEEMDEVYDYGMDLFFNLESFLE